MLVGLLGKVIHPLVRNGLSELHLGRWYFFSACCAFHIHSYILTQCLCAI